MAQSTFAIRADASVDIGTGHVMRCLTLANTLRETGAQCVFVCRPHEGHLIDHITAQGFSALTLPAPPGGKSRGPTASPTQEPPHAQWLGGDWEKDAQDTLDALTQFSGVRPIDWLIVDHYALDARWEKRLRRACTRLMVIDDLADRPHVCDLLLDQNLGRKPEDYAGLVPPGTTLLLGPRCALLRPEFAKARAESLARRKNPRLKNILVTMGGIDKDNATGRVLDALDAAPLPAGVRITVVMGAKAPWLDEVRARATQMHLPTEILVGASNMAELMANCDLAIGAGGGTTWERCALGVPSIFVELAANQRSVIKAMQTTGAALGVGRVDDRAFAKRLGESLERLLDPQIRMQVSAACAELCHGDGAQTVATTLRSQI